MAPLVPAALDATPLRRRPEATAWAFAALRFLFLPVAAGLVGAWAWAVYGLARALGVPRPPVVPPPSRVAAALRLVLGPLPAPGLSGVDRFTLLVAVLERQVLGALPGLAWWLDELLGGRALREVRIEAPLFEISACRSGSTQLARYLEADPGLLAPSVLRTLVPFRWAWWLGERTLARWGSPERVRAAYRAALPAALLERHEGDPFHMDTLEPLFHAFHLGDVFEHAGPDGMRGLDASALTDTNRVFWERDFVTFVDGLGRRLLLHHGASGRRLFLKGHFLAAAPALARRYPDAVFLTMVRPPLKRLQSVLNFHREPPGEWVSAVPWAWLITRDVEAELRYNDAERAWYGAAQGPCRIVVRFEDYVTDLEGTLARIYREGLDTPVPAGLAQEHAHRRRVYATDVGLAELGLDVDHLEARVAPFVAWTCGLSRRKAS